MEWKDGAKKDKKKKKEEMKRAYGIRRLSRHLEKRGLQDEW